jgi:hypothetical protein
MLRRITEKAGFHVTERVRGELICLSERMLLNTAADMGIDAGWVETEQTVETGGGLSLPVLRGSRKRSVRSEPLDPRRRDRALETLLDDLLARLGPPDLDTSEQGVDAGGLFGFRRDLRFGLGSSDSDNSVNAFVLVDRAPVDASVFRPGLLMTGSAVHVRDPYRSDHLGDGPGRRSGSGTGRLFEWLCAVDAARAEGSVLPDRPDGSIFDERDSSWAAVSMYNLFSRPDWMSNPRFPEIVNHAPCEGVAQASLVATHEGATVVLASPLYVRVGRGPVGSPP